MPLGAISITGSRVIAFSIARCSFSGNSASSNGGALFVKSPIILESTLIAGNTAEAGGGVYYTTDVSVLVNGR
jgi:predicted outer membrane repeat protein